MSDLFTNELCYICDLVGEIDDLDHVAELLDLQHRCRRYFKCDTCTKGFVSDTDYQIHKKSHENPEQEFFSVNDANLLQAILQNDGKNPPKDKNHPCDQCTKTFGSLSHKVRHQVNVHFYCHICKIALEKRTEILEHLRDNHRAKIDCPLTILISTNGGSSKSISVFISFSLFIIIAA